MTLKSEDQLNIFWMVFLWICIKSINSDVLPYGQRIKPLKGITRNIEIVPNCATCFNKTTKKNDELSVKITKDLETHIKNNDQQNLLKNMQKINSLEKTQQTASPIFSGVPKENINNRGATFFFTQVEPHRYEYRAMFQHHRSNFHERELFHPFVHHFDPFTRNFPPLPKLPSFSEFPQLFSDEKDPFPNFPEHKDHFPNFPEHKDPFINFPEHKIPFQSFQDHKDPFPNFPDFTFPTLTPVIKRAWEPEPKVQVPRPTLEENFDGPLVKKFDVVLGHSQYPKIFKFNDERINIEEFDRDKKLRLYKLSKESQNELIEPENVKRDHLLILHGGIFTVQEPPLFNKQLKKIRKSRIFGTKIS